MGVDVQPLHMEEVASSGKWFTDRKENPDIQTSEDKITQGKWDASCGKWFKDPKEDQGILTSADSKLFGIGDPEDRKPADWDKAKHIVDSDAKKAKKAWCLQLLQGQ